MKADLYNLSSEKVGTIEVPERIFGAAWRPALVHQVVVAQQANARRPWAHAKDRSDVRGGGKKPWRQKGTGRARHGSIRSPLWIGGGKAHGPSNERDYSQKVNKKMKREALMSALSRKFKDGDVRFIDTLRVESPKTKEIAGRLTTLLAMPKRSKKYDTLLIPELTAGTLSRASRNLPKVKTLAPTALNVYDVLNHKHILIDQRAVEHIDHHYGVQK